MFILWPNTFKWDVRRRPLISLVITEDCHSRLSLKLTLFSFLFCKTCKTTKYSCTKEQWRMWLLHIYHIRSWIIMAIYAHMIYAAPYVSFWCVQIHYEGKWEGIGAWKSRLFRALWNGIEPLGECHLWSPREQCGKKTLPQSCAVMFSYRTAPHIPPPTPPPFKGSKL
jgi:hypothetical protein